MPTAGYQVSMIAGAILQLLLGSAVIAEAVALHHHVVLREPEIDPPPPQPPLTFRSAEAGALGERQEETLELGVGEDEGSLGEDGRQEGHAGEASVKVDCIK
jgi:hypothetical protein